MTLRAIDYRPSFVHGVFMLLFCMGFYWLLPQTIATKQNVVFIKNNKSIKKCRFYNNAHINLELT